jgi:hypothetical protein
VICCRGLLAQLSAAIGHRKNKSKLLASPAPCNLKSRPARTTGKGKFDSNNSSGQRFGVQGRGHFLDYWEHFFGE